MSSLRPRPGGAAYVPVSAPWAAPAAHAVPPPPAPARFLPASDDAPAPPAASLTSALERAASTTCSNDEAVRALGEVARLAAQPPPPSPDVAAAAVAALQRAWAAAEAAEPWVPTAWLAAAHAAFLALASWPSFSPPVSSDWLSLLFCRLRAPHLDPSEAGSLKRVLLWAFRSAPGARPPLRRLVGSLLHEAAGPEASRAASPQGLAAVLGATAAVLDGLRPHQPLRPHTAALLPVLVALLAKSTASVSSSSAAAASTDNADAASADGGRSLLPIAAAMPAPVSPATCDPSSVVSCVARCAAALVRRSPASAPLAVDAFAKASLLAAARGHPPSRAADLLYGLAALLDASCPAPHQRAAAAAADDDALLQTSSLPSLSLSDESSPAASAGVAAVPALAAWAGSSHAGCCGVAVAAIAKSRAVAAALRARPDLAAQLLAPLLNGGKVSWSAEADGARAAAVAAVVAAAGRDACAAAVAECLRAPGGGAADGAGASLDDVLARLRRGERQAADAEAAAAAAEAAAMARASLADAPRPTTAAAEPQPPPVPPHAPASPPRPPPPRAAAAASFSSSSSGDASFASSSFASSTSSESAAPAAAQPPPRAASPPAPAPPSFSTLVFQDLVFGPVLGSGSFGDVLSARVRAPGAPEASWPRVAVKKLDASLLRTRRYATAAAREVAALKVVHHPNVARLLAAFRFRGDAYLVTELAPCGDLHSAISRCPLRRLPADCARFVAAEVAAALGCVHAAGLVFGDVKPENVVLTRSGHAKLVDFGAARPAAGSAQGAAAAGPAAAAAMLRSLRDGDWRARAKAAAAAAGDAAGARGGGAAAAAAATAAADAEAGAPGAAPAASPRWSSSSEDEAVGGAPPRARFDDGDEEDDAADAAAAGRVEGTPAYMPPEALLRCAPPAATADAWALGCLTFACLTGSPPLGVEGDGGGAADGGGVETTADATSAPHSSPPGHALLARIAAWAGAPPAGFFPLHVPPLAAEFISTMLRVEPTQRLPNGRGIVDAVRSHAWFAGMDPEALHATPPPLFPQLLTSGEHGGGGGPGGGGGGGAAAPRQNSRLWGRTAGGSLAVGGSPDGGGGAGDGGASAGGDAIPETDEEANAPWLAGRGGGGGGLGGSSRLGGGGGLGAGRPPIAPPAPPAHHPPPMPGLFED